MEALHSHLTTGEQSGGHEQPEPASPLRGPQPKSPSRSRAPQPPSSQQLHETPPPNKQTRRPHSERKRLRHQRQSVDSDPGGEGKHAEAKTTRVAGAPLGVPGPSVVPPPQSALEAQKGTPKQKRERKPQRPGKYVCSYCGRACAKPSVLQKHIRSHTGERPYPCPPCGFSFKTKSNLYKHRKSHTHRVKAGLTCAEPRPSEEPFTESEDETLHLSSASSMERQDSVASHKSLDKPIDTPGRVEDSNAVKKRLALRLSRGKRGPLDSADEKTSSLILGSRGSTESGYFSRSESTEQSQDSPPNTSAKSYAEIILGKYGRLGHLQRMSRHHNQQPSSKEERAIPFTVPKKQVIDHITKLITINEAVVDTSKIDSVKPRRFSLSRRSSTESPKGSSLKEPAIQSPKAGDPGFKSTGSITMGVPCEKFHHHTFAVDPLASQSSTTAPLLRSHSMPSATIPPDASAGSPRRFRQSQSFDEQQSPRRYGMLRRQAAVELHPGAEPLHEELRSPRALCQPPETAVPDYEPCQPPAHACESFGAGCNSWEGYKTHRQTPGLAQPSPLSSATIGHTDRPSLTIHPMRAGALTMRKRRKEESLELDEPSSPISSSLPVFLSSSAQSREESGATGKGPIRPPLKTFSVIQHTSSFEKQEPAGADNPGTEGTFPSHIDHPPVPQQLSQEQSTKPTPRKLVRQHNVQVPEIRVTDDSTTHSETPTDVTPAANQTERSEDFQWPQRSPSLAQLPIEKLPPKKKRLRLAELAQSSGESSFESVSLPRSPSQDSSASHASSRSASFEESSRSDADTAASSANPLRVSRAPHMLTVPGLHQHREMRRSASEQAPHEPQQGGLMAEARSKSFDYGCLSPERSAAGWRERRKCLLVRHTAVRDPEEEEQPARQNPSPDLASPSASSTAVPGAAPSSRAPSCPLSGDASYSQTPSREPFSQWKLSQNIQLTGSADIPVAESLSFDPLNRALPIYTARPPGVAALQTSITGQGSSGAARAHYLPMSTGLKLEIPLPLLENALPLQSPSITTSPELLRPPTSPTAARVRFQADTHHQASAIYTTMSQTTASGAQEPLCSVMSHAPTPPYKSPMDVVTSSQVWSEDRLRSWGSGGSKRMLSPSNSVEFSPDSRQQQKRVKEEEEEWNERGGDRTGVQTSQPKDERQSPPCLPGVCAPVSQIIPGPSFPHLQTTTSHSWCYLHYIKPNPSSLDEQRPSVYSSWSTTGCDPNPPGLSSKMALALLQCKQRVSPTIYTMSPMSSSASLQPDVNNRPCASEVYYSRRCDNHQPGPQKGEQSPVTGDLARHTKRKDQGKGRHEEAGSQQDAHEGVGEDAREGPSLSGNDDDGDERDGDDIEEEDEDDKEGSGLTTSTAPLPSSAPPGTSSQALKQSLTESVHSCQAASPSRRTHLVSGPHLQPSGLPASGAQSPGSPLPAPSPGPTGDLSPLRAPSPSRLQAPATRRPSPAAVRPPCTPVGRLSPGLGLSPTRRLSPSPGPPGSPACLVERSAQQRACLPTPPSPQPPRDTPATGTFEMLKGQSVRAPGSPPHLPPHLPPRPGGSRGAQRVLSHLPLHSQQPTRGASFMVPIGGIHMVKARTGPLYSLPRSPVPAVEGRWAAGLGGGPGARPSSLMRQDTRREAGPSLQTCLPGDKAGGRALGASQAARPPNGHEVSVALHRLLVTPTAEAQPPPLEARLGDRSLPEAQVSPPDQGAAKAPAPPGSACLPTRDGGREAPPPRTQTKL
ncbi:transcription factor HIVEP3 [Aplochiton taeniatus]